MQNAEFSPSILKSCPIASAQNPGYFKVCGQYSLRDAQPLNALGGLHQAMRTAVFSFGDDQRGSPPRSRSSKITPARLQNAQIPIIN
ncbi:hypothetical protein BgiBS90_000758 [Biomphalaria glabrata]|nr:hypothetical protein BgiBS90_000758 [Biomphalaria glabrata]